MYIFINQTVEKIVENTMAKNMETGVCIGLLVLTSLAGESRLGKENDKPF